MGDRFGLPDLGVGVGLRTVHFGHILSKKPDVDFYEALTENFLDTGGRPLHVLDRDPAIELARERLGQLRVGGAELLAHA